MDFTASLSPLEAAAFYRLGMLDGDDLPRIAMDRLEGGLGGPSVAALAGEAGATVREHGGLFEKALAECGIAIPSERVATWIVISRLLRSASDGADPINSAWAAVQLSVRQSVTLFPPLDPSPKYTPYAAEGLRLNRVQGLLENFDSCDDDAEAGERIEREIVAECARVLAEHYTTPPADLLE